MAAGEVRWSRDSKKIRFLKESKCYVIGVTSSRQVFRLFEAFRDFGKEFRSLFNSSFVVNHGSRKSVSDIFGKSFPKIVNGISFSFTTSIFSGSIALE